jgi:hypothetical protein
MSSTLYTIGTALRRAHAHHLQVALLVESHWMVGSVVAVDGHGVLLDLVEDDEHSVVRLESVSAVRVHGRLPASPERDAHESADHESEHVSLQPA